jgi:hypothetical protein
MRQVSVKTFVPLSAMLACAAVSYSTAWTPSVKAATMWLDDDPNQPADPNQVADPNAIVDPLPEAIVPVGSRIWLSGVTVDPNEPNQPRPVPPEKV